MVSDNLLNFAAAHYNFNKETLAFISDSTNQIYRFEKDGKTYILRFSDRSFESINETKAEMEWLYYLAKNKMGVALPLKTIEKVLVISTQDAGKNFIITSFETVCGTFWDKNNPALWNTSVFYNWGKAMGDMHRLTKDFKPVHERAVFDGRFALMDSIKDCPSVNKITEELITEMMALPKDRDSYGLIHNDLHPWNMYIDNNKINIFDFDDSLYGWFALDIGIALYHGLWWGRKNDAGYDFSDEIITNFIKGYLSANHLSNFWLLKIPLFIKFRQLCKFSWFYDPKNNDEHQQERIRNIEKGILFSDCKGINIPQIK